MLSKSICTSEQVNSLPLECQLLFSWMITHADDDGKMKGGAPTVRGLVFPMKEYTVIQVEEMLQKIKDAGLIWRWAVGNETFIQFPKWKRHQNIRADRHHPSEIPSFDSDGNQSDTTGIPNDNQTDTEDKEIKDSVDKGNEKENKLWERESEGEPTLIPTYTPKSMSDHAALRAWNTFDKKHPELLETRYLMPIKSGVRSTVLITITNDIIKDHTITDKGKEFEERVKKYMKQNSIEQIK